MHFDSDGGVIQRDGDGGDRPARTGLYHFLLWCRKRLDWKDNLPFSSEYDFQRFLWASRTPEGMYFRDHHYNDPKDMARDQFVGLTAAMTAYEMKDEIKRLAGMFLRNYSRTPNGDFVGPQMWALIFRGLGWWWMYPLLMIGDLENLINTCLICFVKARAPGATQRWLGRHVHWIFVQGESNNHEGVPRDPYGKSNVGGDINHLNHLLIGEFFLWTPFNWLSKKLYVTTRPLGVQYAWDRYFNPESHANEFNELARPVIKEFLT